MNKEFIILKELKSLKMSQIEFNKGNLNKANDFKTYALFMLSGFTEEEINHVLGVA